MAEINYNVTEKQMFNASLGEDFKQAAKSGVEFTMVGFAIRENVSPETGEIKPVVVLAASDGRLFSGTSKVMAGRMQDFASIVTPETLAEGIQVKFCEVKCGKGTGASLMML